MNVLGISGLNESLPFKTREFPGLSAREYRIAQGFDSAAAMITSNGIVAAAAEERFTRKKATGTFPSRAIQYCLEEAQLDPRQIDWIAHGFSYEPHRASFLQQGELRKRQFFEVYADDVQERLLTEYFPDQGWEDKLVHVPHHLAHAASAFYLSGYREALVCVSDGMGEVDSCTIASGSEAGLRVHCTIPASHSLGFLYGLVTMHLGFSMCMDEYKVMGLAPYGDPRRFFSRLMDLVKLRPDGTYTIPILARAQTPLEQETGKTVLDCLSAVLGSARAPEAPIEQDHKDIAASLQACLQRCLMHSLRHFQNATGARHLCMAGGVALNCTANGVIRRSGLFQDVFVQPASGDDGTALGAALFVHRERGGPVPPSRMTMPFWGPSYHRHEVLAALQEDPGIDWQLFERFEGLLDALVQRLLRGEVVAWFQGRMEFGPRALGNRSILADPRDPTMRDRINALVKKREGFRPFAPAVCREAATQVFELEPRDEEAFAHMLFVTQVRAHWRERLPAVTHVDGSARVQVVAEHQNPRFWGLLKRFGAASGTPVLLNTSLNDRSEPIVASPGEALCVFRRAKLDVLAIEDFLVTRKRL